MPKVTVIQTPDKKSGQKQLTLPMHVRTAPRRKMDEDGFPLPTALEIEEGKAAKAFMLSQTDANAEAFLALNKRIWQEQGAPCVTRCSWCYTLRYGRPMQAACAVCGNNREAGEGYAEDVLAAIDNR